MPLPILSIASPKLRKTFAYAPTVLTVTCLAGLLVRLTVRDHVTGLSAIYYATPTILIALMAAIAAIGWRRKKKPFRAATMLATAMGCLIGWHATTHFGHPAAAQPGDIRVLFWNTARGTMGWPALARTIAEYNPDVVALVEAGPNDQAMLDTWSTLLPQYRKTDVTGGMILMTRGEIIKTIDIPLANLGQCRRTTLRLGGLSMTTMLVDLKSWPLASRAATLERLAEIADQHADEPALILGDFNTPADSVHFDAIRRRYRHAFETAGNGYLVTWPVPLPILALDHVWASDCIEVTSCELGWSWRSDHRPVLVTLHVNDDAPRNMRYTTEDVSHDGPTRPRASE